MMVDVPVFTGDDTGVDPDFWVNWMEQYFSDDGDFTDDQKLAMAWGFISHDAEAWFVDVESFETWETFKKALLLRFRKVDESLYLGLEEQPQQQKNYQIFKVGKQSRLKDEDNQLAQMTEIQELEVPIFEGRNVFAWLSKIERCFRQSNFSDKNKIDLVYMCLKGQAWEWFTTEINQTPFYNWGDFKDRLIWSFANSVGPNPYLFSFQCIRLILDDVVQLDTLLHVPSTDRNILDDVSTSCDVKNVIEDEIAMVNDRLPEKEQLIIQHPLNYLLSTTRVLNDDTKVIGSEQVSWCDQGNVSTYSQVTSVNKESSLTYYHGLLEMVDEGVRFSGCGKTDGSRNTYRMLEEMPQWTSTYLQQKSILSPDAKTDGVVVGPSRTCSSKEHETCGGVSFNLHLKDKHQQEQVITLISSWNNQVWEPGGVLTKHDKEKWFEKCYKEDIGEAPALVYSHCKIFHERYINSIIHGTILKWNEKNSNSWILNLKGTNSEMSGEETKGTFTEMEEEVTISESKKMYILQRVQLEFGDGSSELVEWTPLFQQRGFIKLQVQKQLLQTAPHVWSTNGIITVIAFSMGESISYLPFVHEANIFQEKRRVENTRTCIGKHQHTSCHKKDQQLHFNFESMLGDDIKSMEDMAMQARENNLVKRMVKLHKEKKSVALKSWMFKYKDNSELEHAVERVRWREWFITKKCNMKRKLPWLWYDMKKVECMDAKRITEDQKNMDEDARNLSSMSEPIGKQKERCKLKITFRSENYRQYCKLWFQHITYLWSCHVLDKWGKKIHMDTYIKNCQVFVNIVVHRRIKLEILFCIHEIFQTGSSEDAEQKSEVLRVTMSSEVEITSLANNMFARLPIFRKRNKKQKGKLKKNKKKRAKMIGFGYDWMAWFTDKDNPRRRHPCGCFNSDRSYLWRGVVVGDSVRLALKGATMINEVRVDKWNFSGRWCGLAMTMVNKTVMMPIFTVGSDGLVYEFCIDEDDQHGIISVAGKVNQDQEFKYIKEVFHARDLITKQKPIWIRNSRDNSKEFYRIDKFQDINTWIKTVQNSENEPKKELENVKFQHTLESYEPIAIQEKLEEVNNEVAVTKVVMSIAVSQTDLSTIDKEVEGDEQTNDFKTITSFVPRAVNNEKINLWDLMQSTDRECKSRFLKAAVDFLDQAGLEKEFGLMWDMGAVQRVYPDAYKEKSCSCWFITPLVILEGTAVITMSLIIVHVRTHILASNYPSQIEIAPCVGYPKTYGTRKATRILSSSNRLAAVLQWRFMLAFDYGSLPRPPEDGFNSGELQRTVCKEHSIIHQFSSSLWVTISNNKLLTHELGDKLNFKGGSIDRYQRMIKREKWGIHKEERANTSICYCKEKSEPLDGRYHQR